MKKTLILILIALLLTLSIYVVVSGLSVGFIQVSGINGIRSKSEQLDSKVQEATKVASTDYKKIQETLETDAKKLEAQKKTYEEMVSVSTEGEVQSATQIEKYEIETLWVKLGRHATSEGAVMKMEVTKGSNTTAETYNLNFTVNGSYISITDFISDIENDSELGFKIEEFKMKPSTSGTELEASFVCKDISIKNVAKTSETNNTSKDSEKTNSSDNTTDTNNKQNSTSENNNTKTNNINNTTNTTSTNSTSNTNNTTNS